MNLCRISFCLLCFGIYLFGGAPLLAASDSAGFAPAPIEPGRPHLTAGGVRLRNRKPLPAISRLGLTRPPHRTQPRALGEGPITPALPTAAFGSDPLASSNCAMPSSSGGGRLGLTLTRYCKPRTASRTEAGNRSRTENTNAETENSLPSHLFLQPPQNTSLTLLTHTLDARVKAGDPFILEIEAAYRLHNQERERLTATLLIAQPADAVAAGRSLPWGVSLSLDGQPVALQSAGSKVGQSVQVRFEPDARRSIVLRYNLPLDETHTFDFLYPISELLSWPRDVNGWRVTLDFAASEQWLAPSDSWLKISPRGWEMHAGRLQWLREESQPNTDILFQALHPLRIQELRAAQDAVRSHYEPEPLLRLGDLYTRLFQAPSLGAAARQRFYERALASFSQALDLGEQQARPAESLAPVHHRLAALYRLRAVGADGGVDNSYVTLMIDEAQQALLAMPQGPARLELQGWVAQGLQQQVRTARLQENWPQALLLTDRLAQLPAEVVNPSSLEAERRNLILHEILQQLQEGNEAAAVALVGQEILAEELLPQPEQRALFANWRIKVTLGDDALSIDALARPIFQRRSDGATALSKLLDSWSVSGVSDAALQEDASGFRIQLDGLDAGKRRILVQNTPQLPDWDLLRSVILEADLESHRDNHLLWQRTTRTAEFDFRPVADRWHSMASTLEREAAAIAEAATDAARSGRADAAEIEIRHLLRAAQHHLEAARWSRLVSDSTVQISIGESSDAGPHRQVWLLSLTDAPQRLSAHLERINPVRLWLAVALGILLSSLFAGVLWLLL